MKSEKDGLVEFVMSMLKKMDVNNSAGAMQEVVDSIKKLASELLKLADHTHKLTLTVKEHEVVLANILAVQEFILKNIKEQHPAALPNVIKKTEKPN